MTIHKTENANSKWQARATRRATRIQKEESSVG